MGSWDFHRHQEVTGPPFHGVSEKSQGELGLSFPPGSNEEPHLLLAGVMSEEGLWRVETLKNAPPEYQHGPNGEPGL